MSVRKLNEFPFEICDVEPEEISDMLKLYNGSMKKYIRVGPKGYFIPQEFEKHLSSIYNMPLRSTDIFVTSYQRSGTTWTQELVWLLVNDLDYEKAASRFLTERYIFIDEPMLFNDKAIEIFLERSVNIRDAQEYFKKLILKPMETLVAAPDPRLVKTHLPFSLMPPTLLDSAKVVYVARDPRDVAVSSYHHSKLLSMYSYLGDFKTFWSFFISNQFILTPYFEHVKEAWALRHHPNLLFINYEELSADLPNSIRIISRFLNRECTGEQITGLCDHLSFEKFQNNMSVNTEQSRIFGMFTSDDKFIRKGKAGGWCEYFDAEMTKQAEKWICDNLRDTDLRFPSFMDINI